MIFIFIFIFIYSSYFLKSNIVYLFPLFYSFIFLYTYFGANYFEYAYDVPFAEQISYKININGVGFAYLITILSFTLGIEIAKRNYSWGKNELGRYVQQSAIPNFNEININIRNGYIYAVFFTSIVLSLLAYNVNELIYRNTYVIESINKFVILHNLSLILAVFLIAFIKKSIVRNFCFIILLLVPFSLNSRIFSLCIFIFYFGLYVKNGFRINFRSKIILLLLLVVSFITSLGFRKNMTQGLIPNVLNFFDIYTYFDIFIQSFNYVTSFSVFASQYAIDYGYSDLKAFYISVNPLPSAFLDIDYIYNNSWINTYAPAPAIAMSYNAGPFYCFSYYFICGFIFTYIIKKIKFGLIYSLMVCLFIYFIFLNSQYIIREGTRLLFYFILFYFLYRSYIILRRN